MWARLVRWLARQDIAYLEYENKELRFELQRWHDRYEGAMNAVRVFERRYNYMEQAIADSVALNRVSLPKQWYWNLQRTKIRHIKLAGNS